MTQLSPLPRRHIKRYGWRPDLPDHRDFKYQAEKYIDLASVPDHFDLRADTKGFSKVEDQGELGSCTANGIVGCLEFLEHQHDSTPTNLSRLFLYYQERLIEGTVDQDSGAYIRDGIKAANKIGVPAESLCKYDISKFAHKPAPAAYAKAALHKAVLYERVDNTKIDNIRSVIASGFPFVFGFTVYESFESQAVANTGMMPMPGPNEGDIGGHCVCGAGYNDPSGLVICRNSWGPKWGDAGYFYMPYEYITNPDLCDDFWVIRR